MSKGTLESLEAPVPQADDPTEFPDRLSIEPQSKFFSTSCAHVGVLLNGKPGTTVIEYCRSGRWVRLGEFGEDGFLKKVNRKYVATQLWDVDIELYWRVRPSRQVRRALKRVGS